MNKCLYTTQGELICSKKYNIETFEVNPKSNEKNLIEDNEKKINKALEKQCEIKVINNPQTNIPELNITKCKK